MKDVNEVARQIQNLIDQQVQETLEDDSVYRSNYRYAADDLLSEISDAKNFVADMNDNQLTLNSIEAEGFLRGLITAYNILLNYNPNDIQSLPAKS